MEQDGGNYNPGLNNAVVATGECYEEIGRLYEEQPRLDWEHLADMMHDYKGLLSGWPQVLHLHSGSQGKRKEIENDGKVGQTEVGAVKTRTDTVTYALLAGQNTWIKVLLININCFLFVQKSTLSMSNESKT